MLPTVVVFFEEKCRDRVTKNASLLRPTDDGTSPALRRRVSSEGRERKQPAAGEPKSVVVETPRIGWTDFERPSSSASLLDVGGRRVEPAQKKVKGTLDGERTSRRSASPNVSATARGSSCARSSSSPRRKSSRRARRAPAPKFSSRAPSRIARRTVPRYFRRRPATPRGSPRPAGPQPPATNGSAPAQNRSPPAPSTTSSSYKSKSDFFFLLRQDDSSCVEE